MARITVEDCVKYVDNRFALVVLAGKRARQLISGATAIVESSKDKSPVLALREIATGKIRFDRDVKTTLSGKGKPPPPAV